MLWHLSYRNDQRTRAIADRHYNRQKPGTPGFVAPGRSLILRTKDYDAFWVSLWQFEELVSHAWPRAIVCSAFRNESKTLASQLVVEAMRCTAWKWNIPEQGMITFVNTSKVRRKKDPGYCFLRAGFRMIGRTKKGLLVLKIDRDQMPPAEPPHGVLI